VYLQNSLFRFVSGEMPFFHVNFYYDYQSGRFYFDCQKMSCVFNLNPHMVTTLLVTLKTPSHFLSYPAPSESYSLLKPAASASCEDSWRAVLLN
jgi:hypothetical protein